MEFLFFIERHLLMLLKQPFCFSHRTELNASALCFLVRCLSSPPSPCLLTLLSGMVGAGPHVPHAPGRSCR